MWNERQLYYIGESEAGSRKKIKKSIYNVNFGSGTSVDVGNIFVHEL